MANYYRHKIEDLLVVSEIVTIHRFDLEKTFETAGEEHDFWELVYADRGEVVCTAAGRTVRLRAGQVLFHSPGEFHALRVQDDRGARVIIVAFACGSEAMHFFENGKMLLPAKLRKILYEIAEEGEATFDLSDDNPYLTKLELRADPPLGGKQMIKDLLELLLIRILRRENGRKKPTVFLRKNELGGRLAGQIVNVLEKKVTERLSVADVCAAVNYGKSYVFQQFRRATGKSVMTYFNELKIDRAKKLLLEGKLNINEIASHLAFDSPNYFTKTFRRITGETPSAWKRSHASAREERLPAL